MRAPTSESVDRGRLRLLVLAFAAASSLCAQEPEKPTLAVLGLQGAFTLPARTTPAPAAAGRRYPQPVAPPGQPRTRPLGELLIQRIDMAYLKTGRFHLVERSQMNTVLKEGVFEQKGTVDDATAVTLGKQLGAKYVLVGSYNGSIAHAAEVQEHFFSKDTREDFYPAKLEVRLRMVRTEDGTILDPMILNATSKDPQATKSFELLLDDFARALEREISQRYPLTGYVIQVLNDHRFLSDLGRAQGAAPGDVFVVLEKGEDVRHPVTGRLIPGERRVVGELVVTDLGQESSTLRDASGKLTIHPGAILERKAK